MIAIIAERLLTAIRIVYLGHSIVVRIAPDRSCLAVFGLNRVQVVAVCVAVNDRGTDTLVTCIALGQWILNLDEIPRDGVVGVISPVTSAVGHMVDVVVSVVPL